MAGVVTHVYVALKLLEERIINIDDVNQFILGAIAPDAIMSKENYQRDDKKISHLRDTISSDRWYQKQYQELFNKRLSDFYINYCKSGNEFALGYLVHLLTDQAFHFSFRDDVVSSLKEKSLPYENEYLRDAILIELDTIDFEILKENKNIIEYLKEARKHCNKYDIVGLISSDEICRNFDWIDSKYFSKNKTHVDAMYHSKTKRDILLEHVINHVGSTIVNYLK